MGSWEARLLENREVHEEFNEDNQYIGPANNRPQLSFCVAIDCHEGYMLILCHEAETYAKQVWVVRTLSRSNFITSSPRFLHIQMQYY